jgi:hypothetical protein
MTRYMVLRQQAPCYRILSWPSLTPFYRETFIPLATTHIMSRGGYPHIKGGLDSRLDLGPRPVVRLDQVWKVTDLRVVSFHHKRAYTSIF